MRSGFELPGSCNHAVVPCRCEDVDPVDGGAGEGTCSSVNGTGACRADQ